MNYWFYIAYAYPSTVWKYVPVIPVKFTIYFNLNVIVLSYPNQLNRLKTVEKLHRPKTQPTFSEASQTEWREPFDFPKGISGFPM